MLSLMYLQKNEVHKWSFSFTKFGYDLEFQILDDNMVGWNLLVDETKNDNHFCMSETFDTFMSYSDAILICIEIDQFDSALSRQCDYMIIFSTLYWWPVVILHNRQEAGPVCKVRPYQPHPPPSTTTQR